MEAQTTLGDVGAGHVLGRYELLIPVASGGMAVVWAARLKGKRGFQKLVAIKTMRIEMSDDADFEQMFLDEASLASRIRHPHVVEILDLGEEKGTLFLVMEWIDGEPLHVLMKEAKNRGGILLPVAVRITMQACAGLHAAHELRDDNGNLVGLVHRDVSPQNILVTFDGVAKVVDFGVAKAIGRGAGETCAGQVKGKASYMAPEQARGGSVDRRSDVFALGIILYMMTTGKHPFRRDTDVATMMSICSDEKVYRPGKVVPGYPPMLEKVVMQALEKDPAKRFPTAAEMLKALDHALPSSMRVSTDEEVAAFVRSLLGDRFEKRRSAIRAALDTANLRSVPTARPPRISDPDLNLTTPLSGVTTPAVLAPAGENTSPSGSRIERWSVTSDGTLPAVSMTGSSDSLDAHAATGPVLAPPMLTSSRGSQRKVSLGILAGAAGATIILLAAGVGALIATSSNTDSATPASQPPADSAPLAIVQPPASPPVQLEPATDAAADALGPDAGAEDDTAAEEPKQPVKRKVPRITSPAAPPKTAATAPAAPPATTRKNLPQIRDPGF